MRLLEDEIRLVRAEVEATTRGGTARVVEFQRVPAWPVGRKGNVVLKSETAVELGGPQQESASLLLWTAQPAVVHDGRITIVGPDLDASVGACLPFGRALVLAVEGFDESNCVARHKELELCRYELNLDGYMMRAAPYQGREWGRVSRRGVEDGFSLATLAAGLMRLYRSIPYVSAVEAILVTSSRDTVRSLAGIGGVATRRILALDKMTTEPSRECDECDFNDVCSEIDALRAARNAGRERVSHV